MHIQLSDDSIEAFDWTKIGDDIVSNNCSLDLHRQVGLTERKDHKYIFRLLGDIARAHGEIDDRHYPYGYPSNRPQLLDNLKPQDIDNLRILVDKISDPILAGRIFDIIWLKSTPRVPDDAKAALKLYKKVYLTEETWFTTTRFCISRAIVLARIFKVSETLEEIKNYLFEQLKSNKTNFGFYFNLLKFSHDWSLLGDQEHKKATECIAIYNQLIEENNFSLARFYINLAEDIFRLLEDKEKQYISIELCGKSWEKEASKRAIDSTFVSNAFYTNAINYYKKIPNSKRSKTIIKSIETCEKIKQDQSDKINDQLAKFSYNEDISEVHNNITEHFSEIKNVKDAISTLCILPISINLKSLISIMENTRKERSLLDSLGSVHISNDGRNTGYSKPLLPNEKITEDNITHVSSFNFLLFNTIELNIRGILIPALNIINKEYHIDRQLILDLCQNAPLIDSDRCYSVSKGLQAGFNLDFDIAIHLLIPQIEHLIRTSLREYGVVIDTKKDNKEQVSTLSHLLHTPSAKEIFDEDFLFELKVLFGDEKGINARNNLAHGLMNDNESMSSISVYIWWRFLKLTFSSMFFKKT